MKLVSLLLYVLFSGIPQDHLGAFRELVFKAGQDTRLGAYSLRLAEPDQPENPTAWQGPLTIAVQGRSCEADVSLVTAVYGSPDAPFVVVITYSGSNTYVHFIAISNCAEKWEKLKAFTEGVRVADDQLSILPACDGTGDKTPTRCFAGRVYKLTSNAPPQLMKDESFSLTKGKLGVGFAGEAKVTHPRSSRARIVNPK